MVVFGTFLPPKNIIFEMKRPIFNQLDVIRYSKCAEFHGDSHGRLNLISCKLINLAFFGGARKKKGGARRRTNTLACYHARGLSTAHHT